MNIRNSPTPIAISGVMNENSIRKLATDALRACHRSSASANPTPNGTAISTVNDESFRLWNSADRSVSSFQSEFTSLTYQRVSEKPCHVVCALPALNENATAMNTGRSVHTTYAIAITHRKRARAHGFIDHPRTRAQAVARVFIVPPAPAPRSCCAGSRTSAG